MFFEVFCTPVRSFLPETFVAVIAVYCSHVLIDNILVYKHYLDDFSVTYNSGTLLKTVTGIYLKHPTVNRTANASSRHATGRRLSASSL